MSELDPKVPGEPNGSVTPPVDVTPAGAGVAAPATPSQSPTDAEAALLKEQVRKYQEDINKMKSTFQSQDAKRQQEWQQRQTQLEKEIERLRLSGMDEEQRKAYEAEASSRQLQEMQDRIAEMTAKQQETEAKFNAQQYFLEQGVPASELVITEDYEALWNSGMNWIMSEFKRLKTPSTVQQQTIPAKTPPTAPPVDTGSGTPPSGSNWPDLEAKYGSRERVYQMIEERRLPPDILPK